MDTTRLSSTMPKASNLDENCQQITSEMKNDAQIQMQSQQLKRAAAASSSSSSVSQSSKSKTRENNIRGKKKTLRAKDMLENDHLALSIMKFIEMNGGYKVIKNGRISSKFVTALEGQFEPMGILQDFKQTSSKTLSAHMGTFVQATSKSVMQMHSSENNESAECDETMPQWTKLYINMKEEYERTNGAGTNATRAKKRAAAESVGISNFALGSTSTSSIKRSTRSYQRPVSEAKQTPNRMSNHEQWLLRLEELKRYKLKYSHCYVPAFQSIFFQHPELMEWKQLARWVTNQRARYKLFLKGDPKSNMTPDRIQMLEELGFDWNPGTEGRKEAKSVLRQAMTSNAASQATSLDPSFTTTTTSTNVISEEKEEGDTTTSTTTLGQEHQTHATEVQPIPQIKRARNQGPNDEKWLMRLEELKIYKLKYSHCYVPAFQPNIFKHPELMEWKQLARWVSNQRNQYRLFLKGDPRSHMTPNRIQMLEELGFDWSPGPDGRKEAKSVLKCYSSNDEICTDYCTNGTNPWYSHITHTL